MEDVLKELNLLKFEREGLVIAIEEIKNEKFDINKFITVETGKSKQKFSIDRLTLLSVFRDELKIKSARQIQLADKIKTIVQSDINGGEF